MMAVQHKMGQSKRGEKSVATPYTINERSDEEELITGVQRKTITVRTPAYDAVVTKERN